MGSGFEERLCVIVELLTQPAVSSILFQHIYSELEEVGSKPCSLLLQRAIRCRDGGDWDGCREAALKAREYAWEQLHRWHVREESFKVVSVTLILWVCDVPTRLTNGTQLRR